MDGCEYCHRKSKWTAYMLWLPPFGILGLHRFYLGDWGMGFMYFFTGGNACLGWILDLFFLSHLVDRHNNGDKSKSAYNLFICWLPPAGLLGAHRFFLKDWVHGFVYFFTGGNAGLGWLWDLFLLPQLWKDTQFKYTDIDRPKNDGPKDRKWYNTFALWLPPAGILGMHRAYLGYPIHAVYYFFTAGNACIGWISDLCRMSCLVDHSNKKRRNNTDQPPELNLFDAYMLWLPPAGILGGHRMYLRQYGWAFLYFISGGLLGLGWLIDFFTMPCNFEHRQHHLRLEHEQKKRIRSEKTLESGQAYTTSTPSPQPPLPLPQHQPLPSPSPQQTTIVIHPQMQHDGTTAYNATVYAPSQPVYNAIVYTPAQYGAYNPQAPPQEAQPTIQSQPPPISTGGLYANYAAPPSYTQGTDPYMDAYDPKSQLTKPV